jgi:hypothetical protein
MIRNIITFIIILIIMHFLGWLTITNIGAPGCPLVGSGFCHWQVHLFAWNFVI